MENTPHYTGRAELTLRVGGGDEDFVRELFGLTPGVRPAPHVPARLVVDAHVPLGSGAAIASAAREAGVPFLIDPETHYLQDEQHLGAPWCRTPFGDPLTHQPIDLMAVEVQDRLVADVINYQISHGASMLIAPYIHIERADSRWPEVQAELWQRTAAYIREAQINLPIIAVVAVGWRCLHPLRGFPQLSAMWDALADLDPAEIAIAASRVHEGAKPQDRIAELLIAVRNLAANYKVTMWQQGLLGELCVVAGAAGYETGIGWREKCDLQSRKAGHRRPPTPGAHPAPRPIYIRELGRSVPKSRLKLAHGKRRVWSKLVCPFPDCCAPAGDDFLHDARRHSVIARARELTHLDATNATSWRWNYLTQRTLEGIELARSINALAPSTSSTPAIDMKSLLAIHEISNARRNRRAVVRRTA